MHTANIQMRVVKGGSGSRFTENKIGLSQITENKIGISHFTKKRDNPNANLHIVKKVAVKHSPVRRRHQPSASRSAGGKKKTEFFVLSTRKGTIFHIFYRIMTIVSFIVGGGCVVFGQLIAS